MGTPLAELARLVDGRLSGDGNIEIEEAATLARAQEGEISFLDNAEKQNQLLDSRATAFVVPVDCHPPNATVIHVEDDHLAFSKIVEHFRPARYAKRVGISPAAHNIVRRAPHAREGGDACREGAARGVMAFPPTLPLLRWS